MKDRRAPYSLENNHFASWLVTLPLLLPMIVDLRPRPADAQAAQSTEAPTEAPYCYYYY